MENYQKIKDAAGNYLNKLLLINQTLNSDSIAEFARNLQKFFSAEENMVKWMELAENRCALFSMPVNIEGLVESMLGKYLNLSFADSLGSDKVAQFFIGRLGLKGFDLETINNLKKSKSGKKDIRQGDLFSGVKKVFSSENTAVKCHYISESVNTDLLLELVKNSKALPAAILFPGALQAKEFYEQNYEVLKKHASILAQSGSGGSNKIFRNFSINSHSLLLATDKFILKALKGYSQVEPVVNLPVKLLILCRLPFEQFTHPYQEAVSASFPNAFMDYALPRALNNFHKLLEFFYSPLLRDVYIIDAKLTKDYALVFKDYYKYIPGSELKI